MNRKPLAYVLFFLLVLLGAGFLSSAFFLPRYIENKILPDLGRQLSIILTGRVYSIGFAAADLGDIILGDRRNPAASIGSIHADYSLPSLLAKNLEQVTINGFVLHLEIADGKIIFPGIDSAKKAPQAGKQEPDREQSELSLPFAVGKFQVSNGLIVIRHKGESLLLPFALELHQEIIENSQPVYNFTLHVMVQGEEVRLAGIIDLAGNKSRFTLAADSLDLKRFAALTGGAVYNLNPGKASIRGEAEIGLLPFELITANLSIDPELLHVGKTPVRFGQITPDAGPAISLEFKSDQGQLLVKGQGFLREPLAVALEINGSVVQGQDSVKSSGAIALRITAPAAPENRDRTLLILKDNNELQGDFSFSLNKSGTWQAELNSPGRNEQGREPRTLQIQYDKIRLQSGTPALEVRGQGTADSHEVQITLAIPTAQVSSAGAEISIPEAGLRALYKQEENRSRSAGATVDIALGDMIFQKNGLLGKADIFVQGEMAPKLKGGNKPLQAEGRISVNRAEITERDSGVSVAAITGSIPWFWPQAKREMAGEIKISQIKWQKVDLGSFRGDITLKDMTYFLDGNYSSSLLKGIGAGISGKAEFAGSAYQGELSLQSDLTPFAAIDLGIFDPALKKSFFSGALGMDGSIKVGPRGMTGMMQVKLQNGTYEFPEKKYEMKGIDLSMVIPSLPDLRTAPAQTLDIAEAAIGNLAFSKGKFVWQLESKESIFLEEGVVQWAGGRVFTNAVRISPETKEIVVPIFCDRLKLTEILRQLGVANAEGEGTVNGRLPLRVGKKTIGFEDGFLYSSPGQGGSVKVAAFDLLSAGIPKNTPQFAQVDFAAEALKNFQYNWVKLLLNSEGEDLVIQMQMDGRPVQSLPFKYDSQTGFMQRMENGGPGINQPIRLDVNFRLPLNRFLGYSGKIQDIMKKMK